MIFQLFFIKKSTTSPSSHKIHFIESNVAMSVAKYVKNDVVDLIEYFRQHNKLKLHRFPLVWHILDSMINFIS